MPTPLALPKYQTRFDGGQSDDPRVPAPTMGSGAWFNTSVGITSIEMYSDSHFRQGSCAANSTMYVYGSKE